MASVYKKARDRKRPGSKWRISYSDENGIRHEVTGYTDKAETEALARKLETDSDLRRRGLIDARAESQRDHGKRLAVEHLNDWHAYLLGKGSTVEHARLSRNRVERILCLGKIPRLKDLSPSRVTTALKLIRDDGASLQSVRHYLRCVKGYSRWLLRDGRLSEDPIAFMVAPDPRADRRHERRALTPVELVKLIETAERGPTVMKLSGRDRSWLYKVAALTGLRVNELRHLTPESFDLASSPATVRVKAAYSKRRREDIQPIPIPLAQELPAWLASKPPGTPLWGKLTKHTAMMMRADLETAGLAYVDASGRIADFHSLRHSYVSALARSNSPIKVVQELARHSTPTLTMNTYSHLGLNDHAGALAALPDLSNPGPGREPITLARTGTDDAPPTDPVPGSVSRML